MCSRSENKDEWGEEIAMTMYDHILRVQGFVDWFTLKRALWVIRAKSKAIKQMFFYIFPF